jgi:lipid-binding SYLF domain-containing protein
MKYQVGVVLIAASALAFAADTKRDADKLLSESAAVFTEINNVPDKGIPQDILDRAQCIGVVPGLKRAGFIVGGKYGKGVLTCKAAKGWSAPSIIRIEGGSVGFQIGAGETDLVFAVMNQRGMDKLMQDKFTVGGDASAMAGPVGRSAEAQTDAMMHAEILSWSRARGAFAGIALTGSTMRPDKDENDALYGRPVTHRELLTGSVPPPAGAQALYTAIRARTGSKSASR